MKKLEENIELRYRFQDDYQAELNQLIEHFQEIKDNIKPSCVIKIVDHHVWLHIPADQRHIYTPHLHLQLEQIEPKKLKVRALFGPQPALWTFFIFLHFWVAVVFLFALTVAYTNYTLNQNYTFYIYLMIAMVISWGLLYGFARFLRTQGLGQAKILYEVYKDAVKSFKSV